MRRNLLARLLGLSLAVAVLAISATSWLTTTGTTQRLRGEFERTLEADSFVYQELLFYAQSQDSWDDVDGLVDDLADRTGRRIALTSPNGAILADSNGDGGAAGPLPSTPTAEIDPSAPESAVAGGAWPAIGTVATWSPAATTWRLTEDELSSRQVLAQRATACVRDIDEGSDVTVNEDGSLSAVTPGTRATAPSGSAPEPGLTGAEPCIPEELQQPSKATLELNRREIALASACLDDEGVAYQEAVDEFGLTRLIPPTNTIPDAWTSCLTDARDEAIEPFIADTALLYTGSTDRFAAFSADGWVRTVLTGLAVLASATVVTILAGRRLTRPIRALTSAAQRMGSGARGTRVNVAGYDEVAQLGRAFNAMAESIEDGERQRKALVGDVAHELRTPLANVRGYLEAAEDGVVELDPALVSSLLEEASLLQRLIDDLQDLALADAGRLRLHVDRTDVSDIAHQVVGAHRAAANQARVSLTVDAPDSMTLDADPARLRQALGNLVSNGVHYTPAGGTVRVTASAADDDVELAVADDGPGIAAEHLPHLFERFYRTDSSRTRSTGGSGLGLAITRQLVEAHGGNVDVSSTMGAGSVFTIRLPRRTVSASAPAPMPASASGDEP